MHLSRFHSQTQYLNKRNNTLKTQQPFMLLKGGESRVSCSNCRAGPSGAVELGQCATSSVVWWQRLRFDRKCCMIPQRSEQTGNRKKPHGYRRVSVSTDELIVGFPPDGTLLMPATWMERKEILSGLDLKYRQRSPAPMQVDTQFGSKGLQPVRSANILAPCGRAIRLPNTRRFFYIQMVTAWQPAQHTRKRIGCEYFRHLIHSK